MDSFEQHIRNNRKQFDTELPGEELKLRVFASVSRNKGVSRMMIYKLVAAASLLITIGVAVLYIYQTKETMPDPPFVNNNKIIISIDSVIKPGDTNHIVKRNLERIEEKKPKPLLSTIEANKHKRILTKEPKTKSEPGINYKTLINEQIEKIASLPVYVNNTGRFVTYKTRYNSLNHREENIKSQIDEKGLNKELLNELITIYADQLSLLLQLRLEIHEINNSIVNDSLKYKEPVYIKL